MSQGFYKHILVMTDFSDDALYALEIAASMAKMGGSELTILHVAHDESQLSLYVGEDTLSRIRRELDNEIDEQLKDLKKAVPVLKEIKQVNYVIRRGIPYVEGIIEIEKGNYDLVVLGSHGQSSIKKFFYGSTVEKVARRSPVSVLITRKPTLKD